MTGTQMSNETYRILHLAKYGRDEQLSLNNYVAVVECLSPVAGVNQTSKSYLISSRTLKGAAEIALNAADFDYLGIRDQVR